MDKVKKMLALLKEGYAQKAAYEFVELYRMVGDYRKKVLWHTFVTLVCALLSMLLTTRVSGLVDSVVAFQWNEAVRIVLIVAVVGTANILLSSYASLLAGRIRAVVRKDLADKTYGSVMCADWETVIQHHSGDLMTRLQEDVTTVAGSTVGWIPQIIYQGIKTVVAMGVILYCDYSLVLVVGVLAPFLIFGSQIFLGKLYDSDRREREVSSDVMSMYKESFHHLQSIKGFGLVNLFHSRMNDKLERRKAVDLDVSRYGVYSWLVMYSSGQIGALLCGSWAVYRIYQGAISFGSLAMLLVMAGVASEGIKALMQQIPEAIRSISASERIRTIMELPEEKQENVEIYQRMLEEAGDSGASVKVEHLNFSYANGHEVLQDVNYQVNSGEIVALVGPSGEGKTTMLRILLGIVRAENAPILKVNGTEMPVSPAARRLMAYVPQGNTMLNGTIADNLRMFNQSATDEEIVSALKEACAYEFVEKLPGGIYHNIGESGIGFSEGQNQRLAIARALMCKTPILLLDEATSALDVATERRVLVNLMKGVQKRTCILTTHRPSVLSMCDRVYRIANKQVLEIGEEEIQQVMNEF